MQHVYVDTGLAASLLVADRLARQYIKPYSLTLTRFILPVLTMGLLTRVDQEIGPRCSITTAINGKDNDLTVG